ncbi:MAG: hypothetical protein V1754_06965 [Pseudomonadota bacterium]
MAQAKKSADQNNCERLSSIEEPLFHQGDFDVSQARRLAQKLAAIPEPAMRQNILLEYLQSADIQEIICVLNEIQNLGGQKTPPFHIALLTLVGILGKDSLDYERLSSIYWAAQKTGHERLTRILLTGKTDTAEMSFPISNQETQELTVGHRKTLARISNRNEIERWLRESEPQVVRSLLQNPKLTEDDVVQIAARRPTSPEIQRLIFASSKWINRYRIKRALILNPYTPTDLSVRLCSFLTSTDIRLVITSPSLPEQLRQTAALIEKSCCSRE